MLHSATTATLFTNDIFPEIRHSSPSRNFWLTYFWEIKAIFVLRSVIIAKIDFQAVM
jgi:hypothetical protein